MNATGGAKFYRMRIVKQVVNKTAPLSQLFDVDGDLSDQTVA